MEPVPGRGAFVGRAIDARAAGAWFAGQAYFNGSIALTSWARQDVLPLLAAELEPAPRAFPAVATHPVAFLFGEQTRGAVLVGGVPVPSAPDYGEFALAVPFVRHRRGHQLHTYMVRMYADYFPPIWSGNAYYGFSKATARLGWEGPTFRIVAEDGTPLVHARLEADGTWVSGAEALPPGFAALHEMFALPIVGRTADGTLVASYFDWQVGGAQVRPASVSLAIESPLVEGLAPRRCEGLPGGTFEVRGLRWRLSWPLPCRF